VAATAEPGVRPSDVTAGAELERGRTNAGEVNALEHGGGAAEQSGEHVSRAAELGLMLFSVLVALAGIGLAWKFYVTTPSISERLADQYAGAHRLLSNKYYVDELYDATVVSGTFGAGRGLWAVDRNVVDGAVNGASWVTLVGSWFSGLTDRSVVDGLVNFVGWTVQESSLLFRRVQTGLVQNYALLMLFGIFAFVSIYLIVR
jgi:NADH-quinone oxidoreductase subunit L